MQRLFVTLGIAGLAAVSTGCSFLLPVETQEVDSRWESFDQAKQAFDGIEPGATTREDLAALGYNPYEDPNVEILDFISVLERLLPQNPAVSLPDEPGIEACIAAADHCSGLLISPEFNKDEEEGVAILSVLNFRRQNKITGWSFSSLVVLVDDEVVYKLWRGNPGIRRYRDRIRPLGPVQEIGFSPF